MIDHRADVPAVTTPDSAPRSVVALVDASSSVERELIGGWLAEGGITAEFGIDAPVTQLDLDPTAVAERLVGRHDDPLVVPIRVVWLPPERDGVRRITFADLATLSNPRKPHRLMQRRLVAKAPDRHLVLTGQPARLSELRANNPSVAASVEPFARAIVRAGIVALERAERSVIGDRYKVPRLVAEEILDSPEFLRRLDAIAAHIGAQPSEVYRRAEKALRELVAAQSRLVSDLFTQAMRPVHASAWKVDYEPSGLAGLRRLNRRYALVFLPSHRSYVDAFVLGDVLARNDFPPNHVIGGANLSFWPMGPIARRTGTVFIRRSFGDDEVYKAVVEEYFAYLLAKRFNLEWYFEGGRTRTGKLRPPRYGLLNYLAAAIRARRVDDAMLVPVSITYERLNELGAIATEQVGGKKKPEGLGWLARYIRNQQHSAGHVYVRFGDPISARDCLSAHGDPMIPDHGPARPLPDEVRDQERKAVQRLAFEVAVGINTVTPVTVNALVTLALLGVHERALTLGEVRAVLAPVLGYIERRRLPSGELATLRDDHGLAIVLEQLSIAKVVTVYRGGLEPVYAIEPGAHLEAAFYRNSAVHWFVNRAILELAILTAVEAQQDDQLATGWATAYRLRDLLKFEFFFPERTEFADQLSREMLLVDPDWHSRRGDGTVGADILAKLADSGFIMAHRVLRSFFDAQLVVAERLADHDAAQPVDHKRFIDECLAVGRQMLLQQRLHSPESVSSELFATALKLADNHGLLHPDGTDLAARRTAFAAELRTIGARITRAAALDPSHRVGL
ncbi:glycerol-3-phosphate 1-O-acyltransferase [Nocardia sp. CDC159]|uniref:Glycerol-3-phosphate 1-O-acyltransferase n=1 Tax=Nocardia pulmonis TaxID=2951408 RepID=A0A9X2IUM0_9NOCA|nr:MULTISPECIES: glycerol-3-phosphate 1-O-acyltransferase [Nocardia]MCM6773002.1 glycerol-3-phosphate 1-O-acyltransferase [Nocardia pulmonis]MCM6785695.1 glycerol-3-phosphate 1-O-acyltransferase [Nocardia sp. CDC159]